MTAKQYIEKEEIDFIKAIGLDVWRDEKVYFVSEVIEFMESYHQAKLSEITEEEIERILYRELGEHPSLNFMAKAIFSKLEGNGE